MPPRNGKRSSPATWRCREGVPPDHPVVQMAVCLLGTIARKSSMAYFSDGNTRPYAELLMENISAASQLFSQHFEEPAPAEGHP